MKINPTRLATIGLVLTIIGLVGAMPILFNSEDQPVQAASQHSQSQQPAGPQPTQIVKEQPAPEVISGHPMRIQAPSVGVDMSIVDGSYDAKAGSWTLNPDKAQFATMTTEPNNKSGQTFIYGHATMRVFGHLLSMKTGAEVYITTSNGYKFTYTLKETQVVNPNNTSILGYQGAPRLLLQTCVGTWSENRKFFILDFTRVEKI